MTVPVLAIVPVGFVLVLLAIGYVSESRHFDKMSKIADRAIEGWGEAETQRDNLIIALEDNFRESNPGEPMPDWLAVTRSMADYRAGN